MSAYQFRKKTGPVSELVEMAIPAAGNQVFTASGFAPGASFKAYSCIGWKSNPLETAVTQNVWSRIHTSVAPTESAGSGHAAIALAPGETECYQYTYNDAGGISRVFAMHIHFGLDMSTGGSKIIELRLVYNGAPLAPFLELESDKVGESASSSVILQMSPGDTVSAELRNISDANPVNVRFFQVVVQEV